MLWIGQGITALHFAAECGHVHCTRLLLCLGAEIDEEAINWDKTGLLGRIETRLKYVRNGNRIVIGLLSKKERRFMWNLACALAKKCPTIAYRFYHAIRSYITYHGIFMACGYDLGERSVWNKIPVGFLFRYGEHRKK